MTIFVKIPTCRYEEVIDEVGGLVYDDEGKKRYVWVEDNDCWINPDLVSKIVRNGTQTRISLMTRNGSTYSTEVLDCPEPPEQIFARLSGKAM